MVYIVDTKNGPEKRWECDDLRAILARELPQKILEENALVAAASRKGTPSGGLQVRMLRLTM